MMDPTPKETIEIKEAPEERIDTVSLFTEFNRLNSLPPKAQGDNDKDGLLGIRKKLLQEVSKVACEFRDFVKEKIKLDPNLPDSESNKSAESAIIRTLKGNMYYVDLQNLPGSNDITPNAIRIQHMSISDGNIGELTVGSPWLGLNKDELTSDYHRDGKDLLIYKDAGTKVIQEVGGMVDQKPETARFNNVNPEQNPIKKAQEILNDWKESGTRIEIQHPVAQPQY